jgi:hypothetical protein
MSPQSQLRQRREVQCSLFKSIKITFRLNFSETKTRRSRESTQALSPFRSTSIQE